jgi:hypothetical protein
MTDRYANIRRALAMGPTPGPWVPKELPRDMQRDGYRFSISRGGLGWWIAKVTHEANGGSGAANAAMIAGCDPDTIRALLAERDQLAAENSRLREGGWQPIETAPKDGTRVLLRIEWSDEPVVGEFTHDRWRACTEHHEVSCGEYCYGGRVTSDKDMKPIAWARIPPIDAAIAAANGGGDE